MPLPEPAVRRIGDLVSAVQADVEAAVKGPRSPVRWVRLNGLHLTLRFLGPTPESRVEEIASLVDRAAGRAARVEVRIEGTGAVPSPSRPRTLWLGVTDGTDELAALTRDLDAELALAGWPPETRPFRPHLTLARADGRREGSLVASRLAERTTDLAVSFTADRVVLFESVTGGGPARYVQRHEAMLQAG